MTSQNKSLYFIVEKNIVSKRITIFQSRQFTPTALEGQNLGLTPRPNIADFLGSVFSFLWVFQSFDPPKTSKQYHNKSEVDLDRELTLSNKPGSLNGDTSSHNSTRLIGLNHNPSEGVSIERHLYTDKGFGFSYLQDIYSKIGFLYFLTTYTYGAREWAWTLSLN